MGANSQETFGIVDWGMSTFKDIYDRTSGKDDAVSDRSDEAALLEADAKADAYEAQRRASRDAGKLRTERERERSNKRAGWGGANLAMSGSKALISDAETIRDIQDEDDVLFEGQRESDAILQNARNRANMLRINSGSSANRSTLSLGSKIYGPRS